MTPSDDLRPGQYVAIVKYKSDEPSGCNCRACNPPTLYTGVPFKILAISRPFISVSCEGRVGAIDLRAVDVQIVTREYAKSLEGHCPVPKTKAERSPGRSARKKHDASRCVRCGEKLVQRLVSKSWHLICPECESDYGPVKANA